MRKITTYLPLAGLLVGILGVVLYSLLSLATLPHFIIILTVVIGTLLATGALHEDGLADVFDGFGGGYTKSRILEIMQDSSIGTYGMLALLLSLSMKVALLTFISHSLFIATFITSQSLSRLAIVFVTYRWKYARTEGKAKARGMVEKLSWTRMLIAFILGTCPLLLFKNYIILILLPITIFVAIIMGYFFAKKIGGYTGDCLGAVQQISELVILVTIFVLTQNSVL